MCKAYVLELAPINLSAGLKFVLLFFYMQDVTVIFRRRGGDDLEQNHIRWARTVESSPDVIEMTFVPIADLLVGVPGKEHLIRAIALYLECKTSR
jgi:alkyl hydroperoxide reductase subunit AhpC